MRRFCGILGVLTTSPFEAFNRYEASNQLKLYTVGERDQSDTNAWAQFERSELSPAEFDGFAESPRLGHRVPVGGASPFVG